MNIQAINNNYKNSSLISNKKNIGFRGIVTQNKVKKLTPELGFFIFNTPEISIKNIEQLLKKFKPNLEVNFQKMKNVWTKAFAETSVGLDNLLNTTIISNKINLSVDEINNFDDKLQLFEWLVHEMTHIYQTDIDSDDKDVSHINMEFARKKLLENFTEQNAIETQKQIEKAQIIFHELETKMLEAIHSQGYTGSDIAQPIKNINILDLELSYFKAFGKTSQDFMRSFVNEKIKKLGITDRGFVEKVIQTQAKSEVEAYTMSQNAIKEILGIKGASNNDFKIFIYKIMSRINLNE